MIARLLLAAIAAGLIAGVFMTAAQELRVVPLILHAETYETSPSLEPNAPSASSHDHSALPVRDLLTALSAAMPLVTPASAHGSTDHGSTDPGSMDHGSENAADGGIMFGLSRFSGTLIANLVTGAGFSLIVAGIAAMVAKPITLATGLTWGALGWLSVHMLPALGLPPELPGFPAADLGDRQTWWLATTVLSAAGLGLIALRRHAAAKAIGLVVLAAPHLWGAPQPADIASAVPAVLGAEFAVAALGTTLAFWLVLGVVSGALNDRFVKVV